MKNSLTYSLLCLALVNVACSSNDDETCQATHSVTFEGAADVDDPDVCIASAWIELGDTNAKGLSCVTVAGDCICSVEASLDESYPIWVEWGESAWVAGNTNACEDSELTVTESDVP